MVLPGAAKAEEGHGAVGHRRCRRLETRHLFRHGSGSSSSSSGCRRRVGPTLSGAHCLMLLLPLMLAKGSGGREGPGGHEQLHRHLVAQPSHRRIFHCGVFFTTIKYSVVRCNLELHSWV